MCKREQFNALVDQWVREMGGTFWMAYQVSAAKQLVDLGPTFVQFILEDWQERDLPWSLILYQITGISPTGVLNLREWWIRWGQAVGALPPVLGRQRLVQESWGKKHWVLQRRTSTCHCMNQVPHQNWVELVRFRYGHNAKRYAPNAVVVDVADATAGFYKYRTEELQWDTCLLPSS